jgi:hypothetical protein
LGRLTSDSTFKSGREEQRLDNFEEEFSLSYDDANRVKQGLLIAVI